MTKGHILVVEDEFDIAKMLDIYFRGQGFTVDVAHKGHDALAATRKQLPNLIILDINLPDMSGYDVCRDLRTTTRTSHIPIIFLTQKDERSDKIAGLELGADDYITKPFHVRELLARAKAVLRRYGDSGHADDPRVPGPNGDTDGIVVLDGLRVDLNRMSVTCRDGGDCAVTTADFKLLRAFLDTPNRALSRDRLMTLIDGHDWAPLDRTIDNQVARLRKKIERDAADPKLIKTIRGIGYMLTEAAIPLGDDQSLPNTA